jgi:dethiobiotin synthetase
MDWDVSRFGELPELRGVLVTGTDTEVGKTLVAAALCRSLRSRGYTVEPFKPVASGCRRSPAGLLSEDAECLAWAADSRRLLAEIAPQCFTAALAPHVAARRERREVDLDAVFDAYRRLDGAADAVVVEGVGGLLCPIREDFWVIHLARMLRLPVVIVVRADLGTLNHTLLTLHAARSAGLEVAGVIVNRYRIDPKLRESEAAAKGDAVLAMHTNPDEIARLGGVEVLALVPEESASSVERARIGPGVQFAVDQVDWATLLRLPRRRSS